MPDNKMIKEFLIAMIATFALTVVFSRFIIPILKSHKMGQMIKDIGPHWHKSKEGTPTMGGICFIFAMLLVSLAAVVVDTDGAVPFLLAMSLGVMNGLIGFVDDYRKLVKKDNEGLLAWQKFALQLIAAGIYLTIMTVSGNLETALEIPFTDIKLENLGVVYYVVAVILITGMANSTNLTDGIDGLASSVTLVLGAFFALCAFKLNSRPLELISAVIIGGMMGFLIYNFNPARVFMGDTGSLFIGGLVTGAAFAIGKPLLILICGLVYVAETISVILQVGVFKLSGRKKRLFKMAPIHHHFEQCGWSENKIVAVFSIAALICCVIAWFSI